MGPYSVHANSGTTEGDFGGLITIKAELGKFVSIGAAANSVSFAVQANATGQAGNGGDVIIEAGLNVELNGALVQALGGTASNRTGGSIFARSFNGFVLGNAPGAVECQRGGAIGGGGDRGHHAAGVRHGGGGRWGELHGHDRAAGDDSGGSVRWAADGAGGVHGGLAGARRGVCAGPGLCAGELCNKSGRKFNDLNGVARTPAPWLPAGRSASSIVSGTLGPCQVTGANGVYAFTNLACGEEFTFCEVLQPGWTQTFPTLPSADPRIVSCQGLVGPGPLGPVGYQETLVEGVPSENNDFGNVQEVDCPEDRDAVCTIKVGAGGAATVQGAYNGASDNDVICLFGSTAETGARRRTWSSAARSR